MQDAVARIAVAEPRGRASTWLPELAPAAQGGAAVEGRDIERLRLPIPKETLREQRGFPTAHALSPRLVWLGELVCCMYS